MKSIVAKLSWDSAINTMLMVAGMAGVVYFSAGRGSDPVMIGIVAAVGIAGVYYCRKGANIAANAWFQRRAMKFLAAGLMLVVAYAIEANNHLSVGSHNQDELTADRVKAKAVYDANVDRVNMLAAKLTELKNRQAWKADVPPAEASQALIDAAKAHRFYRINTNGCTETKGAETTKFCRDLKQHEANKALAADKLLIAAEVKATEADLEAARIERDRSKVVTTSERAENRNIKKVASWVGIKDFDPDFGNAMLMFMGLCMFLSIREWLHVAEQYEDKTLPPWPLFAWMRRKWNDDATHAITTDQTSTALIQPTQTAFTTMTMRQLRSLAA